MNLYLSYWSGQKAIIRDPDNNSAPPFPMPSEITFRIIKILFKNKKHSRQTFFKLPVL